VVRRKSQNDQISTISFNLNFGHELLILNPGTALQKFGADETSSPAYELVMSTIVRDQETVDEDRKTLRN
jgi:hypothetical protein